jgi:prepilin-type N-terminal cleavage/methylation domain-containing protein
MKPMSARDEGARDRRRGFTLVELLVASAITAALAVVLLTLAVHLLEGWSRTEGWLMADRQAQRVLDQLTQDLQAAGGVDDGKVWLAATVQPAAGVCEGWVEGEKPHGASLDPSAENLTAARFGVGGLWLRFFTTRVGADLGAGEPASTVAVAYQMVRRAPTVDGATAHYILYRSEVLPSATFAADYDLDAAAYNRPSETEGAPGTIAHPVRAQAIADHVIDFGLRVYARPTAAFPGGGMLRSWPTGPADLEYRTSSWPAGVDVMVRILTEEGARRIAALEAGQVTGDWWAIAAAHSRVFTRRIALPLAAD